MSPSAVRTECQRDTDHDTGIECGETEHDQEDFEAIVDDRNRAREHESRTEDRSSENKAETGIDSAAAYPKCNSEDIRKVYQPQPSPRIPDETRGVLDHCRDCGNCSKRSRFSMVVAPQ